MSKVQKHLELLGRKVKDKVTGFSGVVECISFDLYGCVQATVHPGVDKDGKPRDSRWFDVSRLKVKGGGPVMGVPDFEAGAEAIADGKKGPAHKPERGQ